MRIPVLMSALLCASCVRYPNTYAPPEERNPVLIDNPAPLLTDLKMNDPSARQQIVRGVSSELHGGTWRWTDQEAVIELGGVKREGVRLLVEGTVPEITFRATGPVTIRAKLNGTLVETVHLEKPGDFRIAKPVPPDSIHTESVNVVSFDIDKMYTSQTDGARFGFILSRVGLGR